jgi:cytochrome c oxidase accessory protein FixG
LKNGKDPFKLTSIDELGSHIHLIPAEVRGFFMTHRTRVQWVLLFIFLALPWISIQGQPLLLLNIPQREFIFFGMLFKAHDAPLIFLLLASFALGLAFVTAIWGRVWCGWACPQTVFIEAVYRRIEILTEGSYLQRRRLQTGPLSFGDVGRKLLKWILFVTVSSVFAHSFIAYFVGSKKLLVMMQNPPGENWTYFVMVLFFTGLLLFNFAWFREQFCVIMCPYGRIQSVLLDASSLAVTYDAERGEPRKGSPLAGKSQGDCVSCQRCVEVCPTGIDIRNGLQMECIACTACIDACDEIMTKLKKPTGLISYKTLNGEPLRIVKFKTLAHGALILLLVGVLFYNLRTREPLNIAILRAIETPYVVSKDEKGASQILNHFRIHMTNQTRLDSYYSIRLLPTETEQGFQLTMAQNPVLLKANNTETSHLFIRVPQEKFPSSGQIQLKIEISDSENKIFERELTLIGPST